MRCSEIGQAFVDHYRSRGFSLVPGSSLLHPSIPMSFVMSAGLAQVEGASEHGAPRVGDKQVMMQTCFRHFDVARIGIDDMHLSLFDMPAAFSFSALTQSEVIEHLWALLTRVLGLPSSRLWVTYYVGGQVSGYAFDADVETSRTWQSLGVPPDRIVGHGIEQNFWKQGNGIEGQVRYHKCGPSTEVFFDRSPAHACGVNCVPPL